MTTLKNQQAELRAIVSHDSRYALACQIDVRGPDIYCMTSEFRNDKRRNRFRISYHGSGASRLHVTSFAAGRTVTFAHSLPPIPPSELKGAMMLAAGGPVIYDHDYVYKPKADSPRRRTLVVTADDVTNGLCVECWAVKAGNVQALSTALANPKDDVKLVGYVGADWVQPEVLIVIRTAIEADHPELREARAEAKRQGKAPPVPSMVIWPRGPGLYPPRP